ncbi:MAG: hypothetical protein Q7K45_00710 [Nanoarchaeota archaeon]|nr:hypothetical protein [Nanoarchaeota archaeon]
MISKISKGTVMDQIYLPKIRPPGFFIGDYVEISPTRMKKTTFYTHNMPHLEPIKDLIREEIFKYFDAADNVIITGSFLEKGVHFNDIDIIVIGMIAADKTWENYFEQRLGLKVHFICIDRKSLQQGSRQDPLFQMMLSKYLAKKREMFSFKNEYKYKILDLHLLKSKSFLDNFDMLTGREKYNLVRNMCAIRLFLQGKVLDLEVVNTEIDKIFGKLAVMRLKENMVEKKIFCSKFRKIYDETFKSIMKHAPQQK